MECKRCGKREDLQEHHVSYEPEITIMLCRECHGEKHGTKPKGMPKGVSVEEWSKDPAKETGSFSFHNTGDDRDRIQYLGWEGVGPSKIYTRALEDAERLKKIKKKHEDFLDGRLTLGELLRELNQI